MLARKMLVNHRPVVLAAFVLTFWISGRESQSFAQSGEQPPAPPLLVAPLDAGQSNLSGRQATAETLEDSNPQPTENPAEEPIEIESIDDLIMNIARQAIPHEYENTKHWGQTTARWDGLHVRRDGWQIKTKRRKKLVNHGTWKRYRIENLEPDDFELEIVNIRKRDGGIVFNVNARAKLGISGRLAQWETGVQVFSVSARADAEIQLQMECSMKMHLDLTQLPPGVLLDPQIESADLKLVSFRLKRISHARGPLVNELGKIVRELIEDKLRDDREKLVGKINRQIDRRSDKLRFSLSDLVKTKWNRLLEDGKTEETDSSQ